VAYTVTAFACGRTECRQLPADFQLTCLFHTHGDNAAGSAKELLAELNIGRQSATPPPRTTREVTLGSTVATPNELISSTKKFSAGTSVMWTHEYSKSIPVCHAVDLMLTWRGCLRVCMPDFSQQQYQSI
jgi:hypothetical protein